MLDVQTFCYGFCSLQHPDPDAIRPLAPLAGDNEPIYYRFALSTHRYMLTTQCAVSHHIMYQYLTNIFSDALASLALIIVTD